jgi:hypothetical protein
MAISSLIDDKLQAAEDEGEIICSSPSTNLSNALEGKALSCIGHRQNMYTKITKTEPINQRNN